ncbi:MAG: DUF302 domain-containing protein [Gammaproteobacteria bacterium]|nr:DUF302 domain-containing protein [Gammaproteobacteria bacterium]
MIVNQLKKLLFSLLIVITAQVQAIEIDGSNQLLMMRSKQSFPEAMLALQNTLGEYDYTITRVQRIDIGLTGMGYNTDMYRVVFFTKPTEFREVIRKYPELTAYMPLKLTIFAEKEETIIATVDPTVLRFINSSAEFTRLTRRWRSDIVAIMDELRELE